MDKAVNQAKEKGFTKHSSEESVKYQNLNHLTPGLEGG